MTAIHRLPGWLRRLLTRPIELVLFSDGDVYVKGSQIPVKPRGIMHIESTVRVWRWRRVKR